MPPRGWRIAILLMFLMIPGASNAQQGGSPQKVTSSMDRLNAADVEPKPKAAGVESKKEPPKPAPFAQPKEEAPASRSQSPGETWREPVTGMEMVWVPKGCYQMGCGSWTSDCGGDEKPVHEVCVDGFWVGKHEVTQEAWRRVMGNNPSTYIKGSSYPVENVSWNDAQEFIRKLKSMNEEKYDFRLPTEAEWEYACRSGGKSEEYSGSSDVDRVAWYAKNSDSSTHAVGTKSPNALGIHDMSGNVWEWVEDIYDGPAYDKHQRSNPVSTGGMPHRVARGGSWFGIAPNVRCSNRDSDVPANRFSVIGFRLARTR